MAAYKLAQAAKGDLQRIYAYGLERWGEAAADSYYNAGIPDAAYAAWTAILPRSR